MRLSNNALIFLITIALMVVIIAVSLTMKYLASKLLPIIVASIVLVSAGVGLSREVTRKPKIAGEGKRGKGEAGLSWWSYLIHGGWVVGFFTAIYLVGFVISIPLFVLLYMHYLGARWLTATIYAAITTGLVYAVFQVAMQIDLYWGLLFK